MASPLSPGAENRGDIRIVVMPRCGTGQDRELSPPGGIFPVWALGFVLVFCFLLDVFGGGADEGRRVGEVFLDGGELLWGGSAKVGELIGDEVGQLARSGRRPTADYSRDRSRLFAVAVRPCRWADEHGEAGDRGRMHNHGDAVDTNADFAAPRRWPPLELLAEPRSGKIKTAPLTVPWTSACGVDASPRSGNHD
jgi:hypothetical protein